MEGYPVTIRELQSALDMDNQLRFGNSGGLTSLTFSEQRQMLLDWNGKLARIQDLAAFNAGADTALSEGLQTVVDVAAAEPMAAESLTNWFERAWYENVVETALSERPALRDFDGRLHEGRIDGSSPLTDSHWYTTGFGFPRPTGEMRLFLTNCQTAW